MEDNKYLRDISEIRNMMSRSTQFISLSGLSGVLAGVYAVAGAFLANHIIVRGLETRKDLYVDMVTIAVVVLILSISTALLLTHFKAQKAGEKIWNPSSRRLAANFLIPLLTGGIFSIMLLEHGLIGLIAPATLIFYGLSCVNASKYTFRDVHYLGLTMIMIGLIATEFQGYGLEFWVLGFGVCHIIYGGIMHFKYDRSAS